MDVVIPNNNEAEIIAMAEKLHETELILLYELKDYKSKNLNYKTPIILKKALLIKDNKDLNKASAELVFAQKPTRPMFENKKISHYFELEDQKHDYMHHRNSGMNQVIAKLLQNKELCFSYNLFLTNRYVLGRFMQNKRIGKKYKLKMNVYSFAKTPYELRAHTERKALLDIL